MVKPPAFIYSRLLRKWKEGDAFVYRPDRGWRPVQRLAFWVLAKIGAKQHLTEVTTERYYPNLNNAAAVLYAQHKVLMDVHWHQGGIAICGLDVWHELMLAKGPALIPLSIPYKHGNGGSYVTSHGFPIMLVPAMEGIILLPNCLTWREP